MKRFCLLVCAWLACSNLVSAHYFAVQMQAQFPTVSRSGVRLWMRDGESGQPVDGALLELQVKFGASLRTLKFEPQGKGEYFINERFDPGEYTFTISDRTVPGEPLVKTFTGSMPRPAGQDAQEWQWPPSPGASGPNPLLLVALLAIPAVLALGVVTVLLLARSTRAKQRS